MDLKTYRNEYLGFEIDVPGNWILPAEEPVNTPFGEAILFRYGISEMFNIQIGDAIPEPIEQTEQAFRHYAREKQYSELEFSRITVGGINHVMYGRGIVWEREIGQKNICLSLMKLNLI